MRSTPVPIPNPSNIYDSYIKNITQHLHFSPFGIDEMASVSAQWRKLATSEILQRSSQIISSIHDHVYLFGGELRPREPRDNDVHVIKIQRGKLGWYKSWSKIYNIEYIID